MLCNIFLSLTTSLDLWSFYFSVFLAQKPLTCLIWNMTVFYHSPYEFSSYCHMSTRSSGGWNFSTPVSDLYLSQFPPLPTPQNYHYSISMPGFFYPSRQTVPLQYFNTFKSRRWWFWNHLYVCDEKKHFYLLRAGLGYGSGRHKSTWWSNLTHLDQSPAVLTFWWYH